MDRDETRALLLRIVNEPSYRDLVISDPVQALAQVGYTLAPAEVPAGGVQLPSNEDIEAKLEEMTDTLQAACASHISTLLMLGA